MIVARAYFESPDTWWRTVQLCIDGVPPFVSYCAELVVAWWRP